MGPNYWPLDPTDPPLDYEPPDEEPPAIDAPPDEDDDDDDNPLDKELIRFSIIEIFLIMMMFK